MSKHQVDEITDLAGTGAPDFPNGISIEGTTTVIKSGIYTPLASNLVNFDSAGIFSGGEWMWMQVGNIVHVSGVMSLDPIAAQTNSTVEFTLPIPRIDGNFTSSRQGGGCGANQIPPNSTNRMSTIELSTVTSSERFKATHGGPTHTGVSSYGFSFMYRLTN
jgi:hypothetical protein